MTPVQQGVVESRLPGAVPIADATAKLHDERPVELDPSFGSPCIGDVSTYGQKLMQMIGLAVAGIRPGG
jgi:hypothetical protein